MVITVTLLVKLDISEMPNKKPHYFSGKNMPQIRDPLYCGGTISQKDTVTHYKESVSAVVCSIPGVVVGGGKVLGPKRKKEPCKMYIVRVFLGYKMSSLSYHHLSFKNGLNYIADCSLVVLFYSAP